MTAELTFAHLTDPHFTVPEFASWREIANKRALSVLSWRWKRRHRYKREVFEAVARDAARHADTFVLTGDLTQAGLKSECEAARDWLANFAEHRRVCVIPGNHDSIRLDGQCAKWETLWTPYMGADAAFPYVKTFGEVAFIGLSSAVPTAPFLASGRLGQKQLRELARILRDCREKGLCRVLLVHHCPVPSLDSPRRGLRDAAGLCEVVAKTGAELVLHGHNHRWMQHAIEGPSCQVPVLSAPSAGSVGMPDGRYRAGYYLVTVRASERSWQLGVEARQFETTESSQREHLQFELPKARSEVSAQ
ncbi:MAG: metallophosphoesterase [Gammaproteobacteria bacterium]|nr:metallophosphoesterase [Gammaproteobacteria bacterium]